MVTLGPVRLADGVLAMRSPTPADAPAWSAARLANREWLERVSPAWGADWADEQSEVAWVQRCWRLRRKARSMPITPFVIFLDGRLIGEVGMDAADEVSGNVEGSAWMVREHGSAAVLQTALLLLLDHVLGGSRPVPRVVAPVASLSNRGPGPALTATGFVLQAVVPRRVGDRGLIDHDMWVLDNSPARRAVIADRLRSVTTATSPHGHRAGVASHRRASPLVARAELTCTVARAGLREAVATLRRARSSVRDHRASAAPATGVTEQVDGQTVRLRPGGLHDLADLIDPVTPRRRPRMPSDATRLVVEHAGRAGAVIGHRDDPGTGSTDVFVVTRPDLDRAVLTKALCRVLEHLRPGPDEARIVLVRVSLDAPPDTAPDEAVLTSCDLELLARYRRDPDSLEPWGGEDVWRTPAAT